MTTAKIIKNGGSQAVRLPREYRLKGREAFVKRVPEGILLMEKEDLWSAFEQCLKEFPADFLTRRRKPLNQKRRALE
jgi:antitoxin VapB